MKRAGALARWLVPLALDRLTRPLRTGRSGETHLILAIADHYEPDADGATLELARERVDYWVESYPKHVGGFRDADGRPPRHTFFYPIEVYQPDEIDGLAGLCREGYGEVEVHLHHDGDTPETLRQTLRQGITTLAERHGMLGRRKADGAVGYAFVHGNWALNNARSDGRWCGVNDEIPILRETGCYADFTYPSAPGPTQPPTVNRLYYAKSCAQSPRGHDRGVAVGSGPAPEGSLLMITGPVGFDFGRRKFGVLPRLENACVQTSQPATIRRLRLWLDAGIRVPSRPDWAFVKLHSHGAPERDRDALAGPMMAEFHRALAEYAASEPGFFVHYVTAREMYNLVKAAEAGYRGPVADALDHEYVWGGGRPATATTSADLVEQSRGGVRP